MAKNDMNLAQAQLLSLITKAITTVLGTVQSILVVRILSPAEFGLVGLVMSIGSVIGVSQHLGIVDGAIREIAVRQQRQEIGRVFWVSLLTRLAVTIPLSIGLAALAVPIASGVYNRPEIVPYILIFSGALVLQGLQDVLGATLTGMKRFTPLYAVQIITATINVATFGIMTWRWGVTGFFWAVVATTGVMVALFIVIVSRDLAGHLALPSWADMKKYGRNIMRIGAYMYAARIFFVIWQRLPILLLGGALAADQLGYINVSLTFGSKLTIIAMALSEVNLSWMSSLFVSQRDRFAHEVTRNLHRVLVLMLMMTLVLIFFTSEILFYIIGPEYMPAQHQILLVTVAFFLYSLTDIVTSSIFVPANRPRLRAGVYGAMTGLSAAITIWLLITKPSALAACAAILAGAVAAYLITGAVARIKFGINILTTQLMLLLVALIGSAAWLYSNPPLFWRVIVFILLASYTGWEAYRSKLIPDWQKLVSTFISHRRYTDSWRIICFAGAEFDQPTWTNRQHIMWRLSRQYPVLYVEPRVWIVRYMLKNWRQPRRIISFLIRLVWYKKVDDRLYLKSQWNLVPWSRESLMVANVNHWLNRWNVLLTARLLGFRTKKSVMWIYDTESAEYLNAFAEDLIFYDCVDDHAAQAGADRNPARVLQEEQAILRAADIVTVTSNKLLAVKSRLNKNTHLVLNAGDVKTYQSAVDPSATRKATDAFKNIRRPVIGSVGALDSYKLDFDMLYETASRNPQWSFVFIGSPVVDRRSVELGKLVSLKNVHLFGQIPRTEVPAYVKFLDVCLIPYRASRYNEASFPLKFWELIATGKPVIVSGVPELRAFSDISRYVTSSRDMTVAISSYLASDDGRQMRIDRAREHSYEQRVEKLISLLNRKET